MVAPNEAFDRDSNVVPRVREWLQDSESVEATPRMRGARGGLSFERDASRVRDLSRLRERLARLHELYPDLPEVKFADAVEAARARLSVEVT